MEDVFAGISLIGACDIDSIRTSENEELRRLYYKSRFILDNFDEFRHCPMQLKHPVKVNLEQIIAIWTECLK